MTTVVQFDTSLLAKLYAPAVSSHKGQNGKLMIIGGSHLFHSASLWALKVASRIVDMVFYSSVPENIEIVQKAKEEFHDGIVVRRGQIESYIEEADCVLIGPGMVRTEGNVSSSTYRVSSIQEIDQIENEGLQTYFLTKYLLEKYPHKKWVIDAGSLQMMDKEWLRILHGNSIITPHKKEFKTLFGVEPKEPAVSQMAQEYNCVILLKGQKDIVCPPRPMQVEAGSPGRCVVVEGGNVGMTKGGTGDALAGLVAALACKNDLFLAAASASFINKKAGDALFDRVGMYFNTSDLVDEIPKVLAHL